MLRTLKIESEESALHIARNRDRISALLKEHIPNVETFIWLLDVEQKTPYLALSYSSFAKESIVTKNRSNIHDALKNQIVITEQPLEEADFVPINSEAVNAKTKKILTELQSENTQIVHVGIHDLISFESHTSDDYLGRPLGWLTIALPENIKLNIDQRSLIEICARLLAFVLRQGRDNREIEAVNKAHLILAGSFDITSQLEKVMAILKSYTAMSESAFLTDNISRKLISDNKRSPLESTIKDNTHETLFNEKVEADVQDTKAELGFGEVSFKTSGAIKANIQKNLVRSVYQRQGAVSIRCKPFIELPLSELSLVLSEHSFGPRNDILRNLAKKELVAHRIVLTEKNTPFLSEAISSTNIKVANAIGRAIQGHISNWLYEERFKKVSDRIQSFEIDKELEISELYKVIDELVIQDTNIHLLTYVPGTNSASFDTQSKNVAKGLPNSYINILLNKCEEASKITSTVEKNTHKESMPIEVGVDTKNSGRVFLEYLINNKFGEPKIFLVELESEIISINDVRIINHLVGELDLFFRNYDSLKQRLSELAQLSHAITDPLSAANASIGGFQDLAIISKNSKPLWDDLRTDQMFWQQLDLSIHLGTMVKLLAHSGKYLFTSIDKSEIDKKTYNLDQLLELVKGTFIATRKVKGFLYITKGSAQPGIVTNGDFDLLYVALANLVDNAIKYTEKSPALYYYKKMGIIDQYETKFPIEISLKFYDDYYEFSVSNVGKHLPQSAYRQVFSEFGRDKQLYRINVKHGTGIGLAAAKKILTAHSPMAKPTFISNKIPEYPEYGHTTFSFKMPFLTGKSHLKKSS